jgi:glycosyltransferase involved in cell wall biosynthesis
LYDKISSFLKFTKAEYFEAIVKEVKPDVVHSFEMQFCSYPLINVMKRYRDLKWIYSCWGSDLFFYKQFYAHKSMIKKVLSRVDYVFADCKRDMYLATSLGFKGEKLGVIPGGSGFNLESFHKKMQPLKERSIILVKGYQHTFGRALNVIKALEALKKELKPYSVVVFGAHRSVIHHVQEKKLNFKVYSRHQLSHQEVMYLMGKSLVYIGNSISDGIPNTLLEAMGMGAFPIQSNPGRVSEEIITSKKNGILINNAEDISEIKSAILAIVHRPEILKDAYDYNLKFIKDNFHKELIRQNIKEAYLLVVNNSSDKSHAGKN